MEGVKLEGGRERAEAVRQIVAAGIPVMGHLGLTPQSIAQFGGFVPQGKTAGAARRLIEDAQILQDAGCFSIVLESVPAQLAELISQQLDIPTIGIGAGVGCDGQVLVIHDLLGLFDRFTPKFVKQYRTLHRDIVAALAEYKAEVEARAFPGVEQSIFMDEVEWAAVMRNE